MKNQSVNSSVYHRGLNAGNQAGVVLFFTLIALVAMTLAALALVRSVETSNMVAGNIALKQGAMQEADRMMNTAFACLDSGGSLLTVPLNDNNAVCNYYASFQADINSPFGVPDVLETKTGTLNSLTGNRSAYVIERMCKSAGAASIINCVQGPLGRAPPGEDTDIPPEPTLNQTLYRISVKVTGPRNTVAYTQMIMNAGS